MKKLGLVLSGGGSKGAYEIGVYKALKKLKKYPDIVTGTSVGAINGIFIVQKELRKAIKLWKNMSFDTIYDKNSFNVCDEPKITEIYGQYVSAFINQGGMDVTKLSELFEKLFNSKKFFKSNIDFGLVTYNLSKNTPLEITKKEMTKENTKDYVIASASCYPAFQPKKINNELYIDGGYYDNMPINLAIRLGATEIIAVDLKAVGFKKAPRQNIDTILITPRNKIVSFLIFNSLKSRQAIRFGYNDTMKTFRKLDGDKFTFRKGNLVKNYQKYAEIYDKKLHSIFENVDNALLNIALSSTTFQTLLNNKASYHNFNELVEKCGFCFKFEEDNIYNIKTYNKGLLKAISETTPITKETILEKLKQKNVKIIDKRQTVKFFYESIKNKNIKNNFKLLPIFTQEFLIALYIYVIKGKINTY